MTTPSFQPGEEEFEDVTGHGWRTSVEPEGEDSDDDSDGESR
jgi:hypothetical protein